MAGGDTKNEVARFCRASPKASLRNDTPSRHPDNALGQDPVSREKDQQLQVSRWKLKKKELSVIGSPFSDK